MSGVKIARILAGSWRVDPPAVDFAESDLVVLEERLMASGAPALAWWRIRRDTHLAQTDVGQRLRESYKLHALHAKLHEANIQVVVSALSSAGIEALLHKGWNAASMYPERALRPFGDIDLWLRPEDRARAEAELARYPEGAYADIGNTEELKGVPLEEAFERSRVVLCGAVEVRVLSEEDRLRTLALHFLKHGGWRPTWLCDVAVATENRADDFDWEVCLTADPRTRDWVCATIALAGKLLGARIDETPAEGIDLPRWMIRAVLDEWNRASPASKGVLLAPLPSPLHLAEFARGLRDRWPNPVLATLSANATFGHAPRLPLQVANVASRLSLKTRRLTRGPSS